MILADDGAQLLDSELALAVAAYPSLPFERVLLKDTALRALVHRAASTRMWWSGTAGIASSVGCCPARRALDLSRSLPARW